MQMASFALSLDLILRVGVFGCFFGHGFLATMGNQKWMPYMSTVGLHGSLARTSMRLIGMMDLAVAVVTLLFPCSAVTTWAFLWAFSTALIRPLSGEDIWAFVERAGNWACPLALLWEQVRVSGTDPLVSKLLSFVPPVAAQVSSSTPFMQHMAAAALVFVAGAIVSITMRVLGGKRAL